MRRTERPDGRHLGSTALQVPLIEEAATDHLVSDFVGCLTLWSDVEAGLDDARPQFERGVGAQRQVIDRAEGPAATVDTRGAARCIERREVRAVCLLRIERRRRGEVVRRGQFQVGLGPGHQRSPAADLFP